MMREPRSRPCLLCGEREKVPIQNVLARRPLFQGRAVAIVGREVFYVHSYDPGERRIEDRGIAYRGRGA
jgi:hypothetical protein